MKKPTLEKIHGCVSRAAQGPCEDVVEYAEGFYTNLEKETDILEEDKQEIDYFLQGLFNDIQNRYLTFDYTDLCSDIQFTSMYIQAWINEEHPELLNPKSSNNADDENLIDAEIKARRKAAESMWAKLLTLASKLTPPIVDDLFGIRYIILNPKNGIRIACIFAQKIFNILCNYNRQDRYEFLEFIKQFDHSTQTRIKKVLSLPLQLKVIRRSDDPSLFKACNFDYKFELPTNEERKILENFKDFTKFYFDPKKNGYQSIHFVLEVCATSYYLPGAKIEFQFRTKKMDDYANKVIPKNHKERVEEAIKKALHLTNEEVASSNIRDFSGYENSESDADGVFFAKVLYARRSNEKNFRRGTYNRSRINK